MLNKLLEKINSSWLFFLASLILTIILILIKPEKSIDIGFAFWETFIKILPIMILVFIFVFLTNLFLDYKKVSKILGQKSGIIGWIIVIIAGIVSSGPIYMWYPLLQDLQAKKMRTALISAFLYNRSIKIPLMPMFVYYFGWPILLLVAVFTIIFSIINGLVLEWILDNLKHKA